MRARGRRPHRLGRARRGAEGVRTAYFLVHMISGDDDYPAIERAAAARFARAAKAAGVERVIYLGGLGDDSTSRHLSSRHEVAAALAAEGPPLTYFRAAMVIGPGSESYELLRGIVERLPVFPAPRWLHTKTQPIGSSDVVDYLREALDVPESVGREIQIGGPQIVSHLDLVDEMAHALGRRPPRRIRMSAEVARPATVAAGAGAVTSGTPEVATEISLGLTTPTVVTDPSGAQLFDDPAGAASTRCWPRRSTRSPPAPDEPQRPRVGGARAHPRSASGRWSWTRRCSSAG